MLHFFRKYQKFFFVFTTIIIVSSFAFFGTYQAFAPTPGGGQSRDERTYVRQMADFLNTEQGMFSQKLFQTNFLNDGVFSSEFLETGMAELVYNKYLEQFQDEWSARHEKEKLYETYKHPYLPFATAETVWSMFAPDLAQTLQDYQHSDGSFAQKSALFLAQKQFPPTFLAQAIRYQEQSNPQFPSDPRLAKDNLGLFGYETLSDWYGEAFTEAMADAIVQTANVARKLGYKVSKDELLADLLSRSQATYQSISQRVQLPVEDGYGFFQLYLRQNGMKEQAVLKIWEDVTLFRRLMHEVGDAALVDPVMLSEFYSFAHENVTVELYQLPKEFAFQSLDDLVKFEAYLAAVGLPGFERGSVPLEYAPIETIENKAPELVGVYYQLYFSEISKKSLQAKVTAKETLEWECDSHNWPLLEAQFPELAQKFGTPFECLESLESKKRNLIDSFARMQIVEAHPEWVNDSLFESDMQEKEIYLTRAAALPFKGISDLQSFQRALENQDELIGYTQDNEYFYRFLVQSKGKQKQVLSFKEALAHEGLLDKLAGELGAEALAKEFVAACGIEDHEKACLHRLSEFLSLYKEEAPEGALAKQFKIRKNIQTITRSDESFIQVDKALNLEEGAFSQVDADAAIGPFVYQFMERKVDTTVPTDKLIQSQELLSSEARCRYFEKLLAQF